MGCFGSFRSAGFECNGCKVMNSCKKNTFESATESRKIEQAKRKTIMLDRIKNQELRIKILSFLRYVGKLKSTTWIVDKIQGWKGLKAGRETIIKTLVDLRNMGFVHAAKRGNGVFWVRK